MLILSEKWITTKCLPPVLRAWVADRAAVAPLGPDNPAAASGTSHHPPPSPRAGSAAPLGPPGSETHANAVGGCRRLRPIPGGCRRGSAAQGLRRVKLCFWFLETIAALPGGWDLAHGGLAGDSSIYRGGLAVVGGIGRAGEAWRRGGNRGGS